MKVIYKPHCIHKQVYGINSLEQEQVQDFDDEEENKKNRENEREKEIIVEIQDITKHPDGPSSLDYKFDFIKRFLTIDELLNVILEAFFQMLIYLRH
jgi:hypothetical protein